MRADATCYRHPDRRAAVACQRCGRPICTSCMSEASVGFHCPEDARRGGQKVYTASQLRRMADRPTVTMAIIGINVAVYVVGLVMGARPGGGTRGDLLIEGGLFGPLVAAGEWYRIVTSGFLHASLLHIGFNMYLLYLLGRMLEPHLGPLRFAVLYGFSLLCGSLGALLIEPNALTVGASGAVFGLMGAVVVVQRSQGLSPFQSGIGGLILLNLVLSFVVPGISIGGHVGGLVGGLVAAWLLVELPRQSRALPGYLATAAVAALGLAVFGASVAVA